MKQAHNPLTGFHDIKLLPDHGTTDAFPGPVILALIALLIVLLVFYLFKKFRNRQTPDNAELSPTEEFKRSINSLAEGPLEQNTFVDLSMALRKYLQRVLSGNHLSLTTAEVQLLLASTQKGSLAHALPLTPKAKLNTVQEIIVPLLKQMDKLAFAPLTNETNNLREDFTSAAKTAEEVVSSLDDLLKKEAEKNVTVSTQSSSTVSTSPAKAKIRERK
ncbi:MAG: hypothetical protein PHC51_14270 [bacterium]|nr:hypothetical protein [bacterium]